MYREQNESFCYLHVWEHGGEAILNIEGRSMKVYSTGHKGVPGSALTILIQMI